jgi:hypothetical protein
MLSLTVWTVTVTVTSLIASHSQEAYIYRLGEYQEVFDKIVPRYLGMGLALKGRLLERRMEIPATLVTRMSPKWSPRYAWLGEAQTHHQLCRYL